MRRGWSSPDRSLQAGMLIGAAIGAVLGLLTANVAWIGGEIGRLLP